jgi:hypothetical protein
MLDGVIGIPNPIVYTPIERVTLNPPATKMCAHQLFEAEIAETPQRERIVMLFLDQEGNQIRIELPRARALELSIGIATSAARCHVLEDIAAGQVGYEAYRKQSEGKSLASGAPIPEWDKLSGAIRRAWCVAAAAIIDHFRSKEPQQ